MTAIEFGLPCGSGGLAAGQHGQYIRKLLQGWSSRYHCNTAVTSTTHDNRYWVRVEFDREEDLTLFALTWNYKTFMHWQLLS